MRKYTTIQNDFNIEKTNGLIWIRLISLVELIVVLVILAILAAIMVPALTSWIDRAKTKQVLVDARSVYLAAQTLASEEYAKTSPNKASVTKSKIASLAGAGGATGSNITFTPTTDLTSKFKVEKIGYTDGTYYAEWDGSDSGDKKWHIYDGKDNTGDPVQ